MSLLEGFSDWVMDEVGRELVPDVERISAALRRATRPSATPFERSMLRLTGLDLKLEQYQQGERFVPGIAEARGPAALRPLWDGPRSLPRDGEIEAPERWIAPRPRRQQPSASHAREPDPTRRPGSRPRRRRPPAIALSPILSARYRAQDLERIRAAAPGARLVTVSRRGPRRRPARRRRGPAPRLAQRPTPSTGCWRARRTCAGSTPRRPASSGC